MNEAFGIVYMYGNGKGREEEEFYADDDADDTRRFYGV